MWNSLNTQHRYLSAVDWNQTLQTRVEQSLTERERLELARYRSQQRREDWLRGRYLAKQLIDETCCQSQADWSQLSICSRNEAGEAVEPTVVIDNVEQPISLSISHTNKGVWVGVCLEAGFRLGVDLTIIEVYSPAFVKTWLRESEQKLAQESGDQNKTIATIWAIKEAAYKACQTGEAFQPHHCHVSLNGLVSKNSNGVYECRYKQSPDKQSPDKQSPDKQSPDKQYPNKQRSGFREMTIQTQQIDGQVVAIATAPDNTRVLIDSSSAGMDL